MRTNAVKDGPVVHSERLIELCRSHSGLYGLQRQSTKRREGEGEERLACFNASTKAEMSSTRISFPPVKVKMSAGVSHRRTTSERAVTGARGEGRKCTRSHERPSISRKRLTIPVEIFDSFRTRIDVRRVEQADPSLTFRPLNRQALAQDLLHRRRRLGRLLVREPATRVPARRVVAPGRKGRRVGRTGADVGESAAENAARIEEISGIGRSAGGTGGDKGVVGRDEEDELFKRRGVSISSRGTRGEGKSNALPDFPASFPALQAP